MIGYLHDTPVITARLKRVSVYHGILIVWCQEDARLFLVLDNFPDRWKKKLVAVSYHQGILDLFWRIMPKDAPTSIENVEEINDVWSVQNVLFVGQEIP